MADLKLIESFDKDVSEASSKGKTKERRRSLLSWSVIYKLVAADSRKRWLTALVNGLVIMVIVVFMCILDGIFSKMPLIFVRFAEVTVGETDLVMVADPTRVTLSTEIRTPVINAEIGEAVNLGFLDETLIGERLGRNSSTVANALKGLGPRTILPTTVWKKHGTQNLTTGAIFMMYDDEKEAKAGIGRSWQRRRLNEVEAHVSEQNFTDSLFADLRSALNDGNNFEGTLLQLADNQTIEFTLPFQLPGSEDSGLSIQDLFPNVELPNMNIPDYLPMPDDLPVPGEVPDIGIPPIPDYFPDITDEDGNLPDYNIEVEIPDGDDDNYIEVETPDGDVDIPDYDIDTEIPDGDVDIPDYDIEVEIQPDDPDGVIPDDVVRATKSKSARGISTKEQADLDYVDLNLASVKDKTRSRNTAMNMSGKADSRQDLLIGALENEWMTVGLGNQSFQFQYGSDGITFRLPSLSISDFLEGFSAVLESLTIELVVVKAVDRPLGKWPTSIGNVVAVEMTQFPSLVNQLLDELDRKYNVTVFRNMLCSFGLLEDTQEAFVSSAYDSPTELNFDSQVETLRDCLAESSSLENFKPIRDFVDTFRAEKFSAMIGAQFAQRVEAYTGDRATMSRMLSNFSSVLSEELGVDYPIKLQSPLEEILNSQDLFIAFINQVFVTIFITIVVMGAILIFTISTRETERKTYELGMLRVLGFRGRDVVAILVTQGLGSAIPALIVGIIIAIVGVAVINAVVEEITKIKISSVFSWSMAGYAIIVGLVVPFISNMLPTRQILKRSLKGAIELNRCSTSAVQGKGSKLNIQWTGVGAGVLLLFYGSLFFYGIPNAFLQEKYGLFLALLNLLLIFMLIGSSVLAQILQRFIQLALLIICIPPFNRNPDYKVKRIVEKQLFSHARRNSNASLMFTLGLAFQIFSGSLIYQQANGISWQIESSVGSDISVESVSRQNLNEVGLRNLMEPLVEEGKVAHYSFITQPFFLTATAAHITSFPQLGGLNVYGVTDEFFSCLNEDLIEVDEAAGPWENPSDLNAFLDENSDVVREEYGDLPYREQFPSIISRGVSTSPVMPGPKRINSTDHPGIVGPMHMLTAASAWDAVGFTPFVPLTLQFTQNYHARSVLMTSKLPGFFMSGYEISAGLSPIIVSDDNVRFLMNNEWGLTQKGDRRSYPITNKERMFVKVAGVGSEKRANSDFVVNELRTFVDSDVQVFDTASATDSTDSIISGLFLFLMIVIVIANILCLITLVLTISANINDNSWEISTLRSIGLTRWQMLRVYVYESLALVLAGVALGTLVGLLVSVALSLQYKIVSEGTLRLFFPYKQYLFNVLVGAASAIVAPMCILVRITKHPIASVLRRAD